MSLLENIKKTNFKEKSKTTSALTCLIGAVLLFNQTVANAASATGTMSVTTSITAVCEITATALTFGTFPNTASTLNSTGGGVVSANCSSALVGTIRVTETSATGVYQMEKNASPSSNQLITFKLYTQANAAGTQLSEAVLFSSATGTGASAAVTTIFGQIQANNTLKESGSYTKSIALSITYSS